MDVDARLTPLDPPGKPTAPPNPIAPSCGRRRAAARSHSARAITPPTAGRTSATATDHSPARRPAAPSASRLQRTSPSSPKQPPFGDPRVGEAIVAPAPLALRCSARRPLGVESRFTGSGWLALRSATRARQFWCARSESETPLSRRPPPTPTPTRTERVLDPPRGRRWNARSIGLRLQTRSSAGV